MCVCVRVSVLSTLLHIYGTYTHTHTEDICMRVCVWGGGVGIYMDSVFRSLIHPLSKAPGGITATGSNSPPTPTCPSTTTIYSHFLKMTGSPSHIPTMPSRSTTSHSPTPTHPHPHIPVRVYQNFTGGVRLDATRKDHRLVGTSPQRSLTFHFTLFSVTVVVPSQEFERCVWLFHHSNRCITFIYIVNYIC